MSTGVCDSKHTCYALNNIRGDVDMFKRMLRHTLALAQPQRVARKSGSSTVYVSTWCWMEHVKNTTLIIMGDILGAYSPHSLNQSLPITKSIENLIEIINIFQALDSNAKRDHHNNNKVVFLAGRLDVMGFLYGMGHDAPKLLEPFQPYFVRTPNTLIPGNTEKTLKSDIREFKGFIRAYWYDFMHKHARLVIRWFDYIFSFGTLCGSYLQRQHITSITMLNSLMSSALKRGDTTAVCSLLFEKSLQRGLDIEESESKYPFNDELYEMKRQYNYESPLWSNRMTVDTMTWREKDKLVVSLKLGARSTSSMLRFVNCNIPVQLIKSQQNVYTPLHAIPCSKLSPDNSGHSMIFTGVIPGHQDVLFLNNMASNAYCYFEKVGDDEDRCPQALFLEAERQGPTWVTSAPESIVSTLESQMCPEIQVIVNKS
jgi:hypothetical protein